MCELTDGDDDDSDDGYDIDTDSDEIRQMFERLTVCEILAVLYNGCPVHVMKLTSHGFPQIFTV